MLLIEIKSEYQYSNEIRDSIIEFAHRLCAELGNQNIKIYAGANRHLLDFNKFPIVENAKVKILGEAEGPVYIDCRKVKK